MKNFDLPSNTHMGGWFIPHNIVNQITDFWNNPENQKHKVDGKSYTQPVDGINTHEVIDVDVKESLELYVIPHSDVEPFKQYEIYLQKCLNQYVKRYPSASWTESYSLCHPYNVQWYPNGGGFKQPHIENGGSNVDGHRHLVFMTYLNDIVDGGTHFPNQNITTPSIKGLTLIWPSYFTHPHKSQISKTNEKIIVTGWWSFNKQYDSYINNLEKK